MPLYRWQWTLANGGSVEAELDSESATETVTQGTRVLSKSARGEKPDGHVVQVEPHRVEGMSERPPLEAVLTFAETAPICVLRVDGHEVVPTVWPKRTRPSLAPPEARSGASFWILGIALVVVVIAFGIRALRGGSASTTASDPRLKGTLRGLNGLFVAHYPADWEPRLAVLPSGVGGIVLEDKPRTASIVVAALTLDETTARDAWTLQQRLRAEVFANLPKGAGGFVETARRDDTCHESPGAVVIGNVVHNGTPVARIWSCAFVRDGAGYYLLYMLAEPVEADGELRARAIIDATELTHLADLGPIPSGANGILPIDPATMGSALPR